jgi:DNA mismatch repair protein MutS
MRQYVEQKKQVGDAILLFRMGDFYETFYEDAVTAARVLGIALTARNKGDNPIPLAGIPYHALEGYLRKLVDAGLRVAISEQIEDPKLAKGVVKRDIVRIVTPGTLTDDGLLDDKAESHLAAICGEGAMVGIATVDLASGRFLVYDAMRDGVLDELVRLGPAELLIEDDRQGPAERLGQELVAVARTALARRSPHEFSTHGAERTLGDHFGVATLEGFGFTRMNLSLRAAGAILSYLRETQKTALDHITALQRRSTSQFVSIDHNTWRALEIEKTIRGQTREGSLLAAIDLTVHPIGARRLRDWICLPLREAAEIIARQDAVATFVESDALRRNVRARLKNLADVERIAARVALLRASPRDLAHMATTLLALPELARLLEPAPAPLLVESRAALCGLEELAAKLAKAIRADAPPVLREGGVIADGYHAELDRLRGIRENGQAFLAEYQRQLIEQTGIASLKVGYNKVFGYYIEVSNTHRDKVPPEFVRKQTIKNAERYITDTLKKYEEEVLSAAERAITLEVQLFEELRAQLAGHLAALQRVGQALGLIDVTSALADLAVQRRYVRPVLADDGSLEIREGRHPVLDQTLGNAFVPNDCRLAARDQRVLVITGPNMAGKSTYIRQVALLALLAQTGSYVPADAMTLSPVDKVFARVGAADELARGQSTFMVEMTEAAVILNTATERSLVVLDELGRGTSTFDGLSLAWAITEHLATKIRCRTLVATHYHELTELADLLEGVANFSVAVREYEDPTGRDSHVVFLHRIIPGRTDKSYGIHVARMAGVPKPVIQRSKAILEDLHKGFSRESQTTQLARRRSRNDGQLLLFVDPAEEVARELAEVDPTGLSGEEAVELLRRLKAKLGG